jgi:hypothetical protein
MVCRSRSNDRTVISTCVVTVRPAIVTGRENLPRESVQVSNSAPNPSHELTSTSTLQPREVLPLTRNVGGTFSPLRMSTRRNGLARAGIARTRRINKSRFGSLGIAFWFWSGDGEPACSGYGFAKSSGVKAQVFPVEFYSRESSPGSPIR